VSEFDALFDDFEHTAFRYEGRRLYDVGGAEAERIQAWREHQPRPERSVRTSPWLRRIAVTTAAGKDWCRVRTVDWPLPEYLRYELGGYIESQAAGDRIHMVDRNIVPDGAPDFWLFDGGTEHARAAVMTYSADGAFEGFRLITHHAELALLDEIRTALLARATPLNVFLASLESSVA
jgi:hypothetical protein